MVYGKNFHVLVAYIYRKVQLRSFQNLRRYFKPVDVSTHICLAAWLRNDTVWDSNPKHELWNLRWIEFTSKMKKHARGVENGWPFYRVDFYKLKVKDEFCCHICPS